MNIIEIEMPLALQTGYVSFPLYPASQIEELIERRTRWIISDTFVNHKYFSYINDYMWIQMGGEEVV